MTTRAQAREQRPSEQMNSTGADRCGQPDLTRSTGNSPGPMPTGIVTADLPSVGVEPSRGDVLPHSPEVKSYVSQWSSLVIVDGVAYIVYND